jgi:hypothetical protein
MRFFLGVVSSLAILIILVIVSSYGHLPVLLMPLFLVGISVLTNADAGKNRSGRYRQYGLSEIVGPDEVVVVTESIHEIGGAMEEMLSQGEQVICLNGGDGTVQRVMTHLLQNSKGEDIPILFPLRGGTMNLLADNLEIKGTTPELLQRAVNVVRNEERIPFVRVPTLKVVREMNGKQDVEYGFFFGHGALYRFHRLYYKETQGGPAAAAGLFLKCLFGATFKKTHYKDIFGLVPAKIMIDDFEMPADMFTIILAMIFKVKAITFRPFREEGHGDFYVLATSVPIFRMLRRLHKLLWVKEGDPPYPVEEYYNRKASRIFMESCEGYSLDGEVFELEDPYRVTITRGPSVKILKV